MTRDNFLKFFPVVSPILFFLIVILLGLITPGYDSLNHTISRLSIEKYGFPEQLNLIQFAFGLYFSGRLLANNLKSNSSKKAVNKGSNFLFIMLILAVIFTSDPIENTHFNISRLTLKGFIHFLVIWVFVITSPLGIVKLARIFKSEPCYKNLASLTLFMGFSAFTACLIWIMFFVVGFLPEYRGLFEKIIALWVIIFIVLVNLQILKYQRFNYESKAVLKSSKEV